MSGESVVTRLEYATWDMKNARTQMSHGGLRFRAEWFAGWLFFCVRYWWLRKRVRNAT